MDDSKRLDEVLRDYIRPLTFPVAVKFMKGEPLPEKAKRPLKFLGHPIALCQGFGFARRYGWTIGFQKEDHACPPALVMFGYVEMPEFMKKGGIIYPLYAKTEEAAERSESAISKLEYGSVGNILIAPLRKTDFTPDIVLIYGLPGQILRLIQGAVYAEGGAIESRILGRCACSAELIMPYLQQKCHVVVPDGGELLFAGTETSEMVFAVPYRKVRDLIEGIVTTHESGISRLPFPIHGLGAQPRFPDKYTELGTVCGLYPREGNPRTSADGRGIVKRNRRKPAKEDFHERT